MLYLTCSMIPSVDLAWYRVSRVGDLGICEMCYNKYWGTNAKTISIQMKECMSCDFSSISIAFQSYCDEAGPRSAIGRVPDS